MTLETCLIVGLVAVCAVLGTLLLGKRSDLQGVVDGPKLFRTPDGREIPLESEEARQFIRYGHKIEAHESQLGIPERHPPFDLPDERTTLVDPDLNSSQRTCGNCKFFDLEGGQEVFRQHPTFLRAAQVIPPSEYGRQAKHEDVRCEDCTQQDGTPIDPTLGCVKCGGHRTYPTVTGRTPAHFPVRARWSQFGLCELGQADQPVAGAPDNVVWSGRSGCGGKLFAINLRRLA